MAALVRHSVTRPLAPSFWEAPLLRGPPRRLPPVQLTNPRRRTGDLEKGRLRRRGLRPEFSADLTSSRWAELRCLLRTAWPMVMAQVGLVAMGMVDTIMVRRFSAEVLGGVALGTSYRRFLFTLGQGSLMLLDGIISGAAGACDSDKVGSGLLRGLALAFVYALPLMPLLQLCAPVLHALGQPPELIPLAAEYAAVQAWALLPTFLFVVLRQTLQALNKTRLVTLSILVANVCNVFLNLVFIWGLPGLGIRGLGPVGSSWATVFCTWIMLALVALAGRQTWSEYGTRPGALRSLRIRPLVRLALMCLPIGLQLVTKSAFFHFMMVSMGQLGAVPAASHKVAMNVAELNWCISLGIASAAAIRTGQALGRRDTCGVQRAATVSIAFGAVLMGSFGFVLMLFPAQIAALWTSDARVVAQVAILLPIVGTFQVFDSTQTIAAGVLRGLLDTKGLLLASLVGSWLIGAPCSFMFSRHFGYGAAGVWWGMVVGLASVASLLLLRVWWRVRSNGAQRWTSEL